MYYLVRMAERITPEIRKFVAKEAGLDITKYYAGKEFGFLGAGVVDVDETTIYVCSTRKLLICRNCVRFSGCAAKIDV